MCYGLGCPWERPHFGDCGGRHLREGCWIRRNEREQEKKRMDQQETRFHCPDCEADNNRRWLWADAAGFTCLDCGMTCTAAELQECYRGELDDRLNDAEYLRSLIAGLDAWA